MKIPVALLLVAGLMQASANQHSRVCLMDGCDNGAIVDAGNDEESLGVGTPGKRSRLFSPRVCLNTMSDGCANGGTVNAGNDEESLLDGTPGKRSRLFSPRVCLNTMSDGCANGGTVNAGNDEESLLDGTPGKRSEAFRSNRCVNTMSDCQTGDELGSANDQDDLHGQTPGKRSFNGDEEGRTLSLLRYLIATKQCAGLQDERCIYLNMLRNNGLTTKRDAYNVLRKLNTYFYGKK